MRKHMKKHLKTLGRWVFIIAIVGGLVIVPALSAFA